MAAQAATADYRMESVVLAAQVSAVPPEQRAPRKVPDNQKIHTCEAIFAPHLLFDQM
jgi:hypothetical protein